MLELRAEGDTHPKTFKLVTDDADGELDRIQEILRDEVGLDPDDPIWVWFNGTSADQFKEGAEVDHEQIADLSDMLEGDFPQVGEVVAEQRQEALAEIEAKQAEAEG